MTYRVTATLGRSTADYDELLAQGRSLTGALDDADVVVDPVKAALQVVLHVPADDALAAAAAAVGVLRSGLERAGLELPASIAHVEAESVPAPAEGHSQPTPAG